MSQSDTQTEERNLGGRPLMFNDPKELEERINEYFAECDKGELVEAVNKQGQYVTFHQKLPYTLEGLALHLNCSDETIRKYAKRDGFIGIISRARLKVYNSWVTYGLTGQFNPKMTALCLAANTKTYNIVKQSEHNETLTIEQRLREAKKTKAIEGHIPEAEIKEITNDK